ncbi:Uncharacterised protein [Vibrio cholerae]|nr:Uncharacterised protein [Vibrio cholerae]CSI59201.1 Uncharacterised protein [Vibrio cholerae]CSI88136.1 Uncharacterised protein [Vibrio cholerae]
MVIQNRDELIAIVGSHNLNDSVTVQIAYRWRITRIRDHTTIRIAP